MCRACGDPRGGRRCEVSKSNSETSRAREQNNRNFRRELAAATAAQFGPKLGRRVLAAEFSDMPALVEALGADPEGFDNEMPGTTPQAHPTSPDAKKLAKDIAKSIERRKAAAELEAEKKASQKAAAEEAAARAAEESAATEESEDTESAATPRLSPEDAARLEELERQRRRLERAADNALDRGRESVAARYESELEGVYAEIEELEGSSSSNTSPAPEPSPEPEPEPEPEPDTASEASEREVAIGNEVSATAAEVSDKLESLVTDDGEYTEESLWGAVEHMGREASSEGAPESARTDFEDSLREVTRGLEKDVRSVGVASLAPRERDALARSLGTSDVSLTSADVALNRDAIEADTIQKFSGRLTGATTADAVDDAGVRAGLAELESRGTGLKKVHSVRSAADAVLDDYREDLGSAVEGIPGAGTDRIRTGHSDAAVDADELVDSIARARKELDNPAGSRNLENLAASPTAQSREIEAREESFGIDNDRHVLDRRVAPIPSGDMVLSDQDREVADSMLEYDLEVPAADRSSFVPTDTELGTIIEKSYGIFEEESGLYDGDMGNDVEAAAVKANHREFKRLVDVARKDPAQWRSLVAFAHRPTAHGADPKNLTEDQLLNDMAPDPNQLNLF